MVRTKNGFSSQNNIDTPYRDVKLNVHVPASSAYPASDGGGDSGGRSGGGDDDDEDKNRSEGNNQGGIGDDAPQPPPLPVLMSEAGTVAEVQLVLKPYLAAKSYMHVLYEVVRGDCFASS